MSLPHDPAWDLVRQVLEAGGTVYEPLVCDPAFADTAAFCERYGIAPGESANTILVASRQEPRLWAACLVLATCRLDVNHAVRQKLGVKRLSFASAEETAEKTGMMIGGVTPYGLPAGMPIYIDSRLLDVPRVVVGGGSRSWKLRLDPRELTRIAGAEVVADLATERPVEPHEGNS